MKIKIILTRKNSDNIYIIINITVAFFNICTEEKLCEFLCEFEKTSKIFLIFFFREL